MDNTLNITRERFFCFLPVILHSARTFHLQTGLCFWILCDLIIRAPLIMTRLHVAIDILSSKCGVITSPISAGNLSCYVLSWIMLWVFLVLICMMQVSPCYVVWHLWWLLSRLLLLPRKFRIGQIFPLHLLLLWENILTKHSGDALQVQLHLLLQLIYLFSSLL